MKKTEKAIREALADMLDILAYKVRNGAMTADDVRAVMDFLDDPDGSRSKAFDHFVVDCRAKDEPIFFDEML